MRSQLRVTFDAVRDVANKTLGNVVPGDALFDQQRERMLQSSVLLREVDAMIQQQADGSPEGELRRRALALVFLISRLPQELGIKTTADTLADLLVEDLERGSSQLRMRLPDVLAPLVNRELMLDGAGEYRLQTKESADWNQTFQRRAADLRSDDGKIGTERVAELRDVISRSLRGLTVVQGVSKTVRQLDISSGDNPPTSGREIPVWICDGWAITENQARKTASNAGVESPLVVAFVARQFNDDIKDAIIDYLAAIDTIGSRAVPSTPEGLEARTHMESRQRQARQRLDRLMQTLVDDALVLKGGGVEARGATLRERVQQAALDSAERLFPKFADADHASWETVQRRASEGSPQALEALGFTGDVGQHPVCKRIFEFVAGGKKGTEVQAQFEAPPYGWPRDAIRAALLVLLANGMITARQNGVDVPVRGLTMTKIGSTDFRSEDVVITTMQKIELRKLAQTVGIQPTQGNESDDIARVLQQLLDTARQAGGEPPAPAPPETTLLNELLALSGNHRLQRVWEERATLEACHGEWSKAANAIRDRLPAWRGLQRQLAHATGLPGHGDIAAQVAGILDQRLLLHRPDPIVPLTGRLTSALRGALIASHKSLSDARTAARDALASNSDWACLPADQQRALLSEHQLDPPGPLDIDNDTLLLETLDQAPLRTWPDRIAAVSQRFNDALLAATKVLEPQTVHVALEPRTLRSQSDVDAYLAEVRARLLAVLDAGNTVVVG
jgi:hypothetical protein